MCLETLTDYDPWCIDLCLLGRPHVFPVRNRIPVVPIMRMKGTSHGIWPPSIPFESRDYYGLYYKAYITHNLVDSHLDLAVTHLSVKSVFHFLGVSLRGNSYSQN